MFTMRETLKACKTLDYKIRFVKLKKNKNHSATAENRLSQRLIFCLHSISGCPKQQTDFCRLKSDCSFVFPESRKQKQE
ncbi:MAG: hypothetical protein JW774_07120 [Candidatus Aureabacteria bacterium]|nr:hypothetical protein [Candidatus Auribacterota bacterium]